MLGAALASPLMCVICSLLQQNPVCLTPRPLSTSGVPCEQLCGGARQMRVLGGLPVADGAHHHRVGVRCRCHAFGHRRNRICFFAPCSMAPAQSADIRMPVSFSRVQGTCNACGMDTWGGGSISCQNCPANSKTLSTASTAITQCLCNPGTLSVSIPSFPPRMMHVPRPAA